LLNIIDNPSTVIYNINELCEKYILYKIIKMVEEDGREFFKNHRRGKFPDTICKGMKLSGKRTVF